MTKPSNDDVQGLPKLDLFQPGDRVEVTEPIWISGKVAQDAGDPPDIPMGTQFYVLEDEDDEVREDEIELISPDLYKGSRLATYPMSSPIATLILPKTSVRKISSSRLKHLFFSLKKIFSRR